MKNPNSNVETTPSQIDGLEQLFPEVETNTPTNIDDEVNEQAVDGDEVNEQAVDGDEGNELEQLIGDIPDMGEPKDAEQMDDDFAQESIQTESNKKLPSLNEFDLVTVVTSESNLYSVDMILSEITSTSLTLMMNNGQSFELEIADDGSLKPNNKNIIFIRKIEDDADDIDGIGGINRGDDGEEDEDEVDAVPITQTFTERKGTFEQQYDIREQKKVLYEYYINLVENKNEFHEKRVNKLIDDIYNAIEDATALADDMHQNKYYLQYIKNEYGLDWLIPIVYNKEYDKKKWSQDVVLQIHEQLYKSLHSTVNPIYSRRPEFDDQNSTHKGRAYYDNIIYNGTTDNLVENIGLNIEVPVEKNSDSSEQENDYTRLEAIGRPLKRIIPEDDEYVDLIRNSIDNVNASSFATVLQRIPGDSLGNEPFKFRTVDGPTYFNTDNFLPKYKDKHSRSLETGENSMRMYLDPIYNAGQNIEVNHDGKIIPIDWCSLRRPPTDRLWIDPEKMMLSGWFIDSSKLNNLTPYSVSKTTKHYHDSLISYKTSNFQPGYNVLDLVRQDQYYNRDFQHSFQSEMLCNFTQKLKNDFSFPREQTMNTAFSFENYPDLKKELEDHLRKKQTNKDISDNSEGSSDDVNEIDNQEVLQYLNRMILSKLLPSAENIDITLENHEDLSKNITNLNALDRFLLPFGLQSSQFRTKDLDRIGFWSNVLTNISKIQKHNSETRETHSIYRQVKNSFRQMDLELLQYTLDIDKSKLSIEVYYNNVLSIIRNYFGNSEISILHQYIKTHHITERMIHNLRHDNTELAVTLNTYGKRVMDTANISGQIVKCRLIDEDIIFTTTETDKEHIMPFHHLENEIKLVHNHNTDHETLMSIIASDFIQQNNLTYLDSVTLQIYKRFIDLERSGYATDIRNFGKTDKVTDSADGESTELDFFIISLFNFLNIEPVDQTNVFNLRDLYMYIVRKAQTRKYSAYSEYMHPYKTFELLKSYFVSIKDKKMFRRQLDDVILEKYNKLNFMRSEQKTRIEEISEPSLLLQQYEDNDMKLLSERIVLLVISLEHYLETLNFCKANNITVPIVKMYEDTTELQRDNGKEDIPVDLAFDTRTREFDLIRNILKEYTTSSEPLSPDTVRQLLHEKEIDILIRRLFYHEIEKTYYDTFKEDFISYYQTGEIPVLVIRPEHYCLVRNGPCNIYKRNEHNQWQPYDSGIMYHSSDSDDSHKDNDIYDQLGKLLHFGINSVERYEQYREFGGYDINLSQKTKIINLIRNSNAHILMHNVQYLFNQNELYRKRSNMFSASKNLSHLIMKYRSVLGTLNVIYDNITIELDEKEEKARREEKLIMSQYQTMLDDIYLEIEKDEDYGLTQMENFVNKYGIIDTKRNAYVDVDGHFLLCRHWTYLFGNNKLSQEERKFRIEELLSKFSMKMDNVHIHCRYCGEILGESDPSDMDGFKDGKPIVSRTKVYTKVDEDNSFIPNKQMADVDSFVRNFCGAFGITLRVKERKELIEIVLKHTKHIKTLEELLDEGAIQNEFVRNTNMMAFFKKNIEPRFALGKGDNSKFQLGYEAYKRTKGRYVTVERMKLALKEYEIKRQREKVKARDEKKKLGKKKGGLNINLQFGGGKRLDKFKKKFNKKKAEKAGEGTATKKDVGKDVKKKSKADRFKEKTKSKRAKKQRDKDKADKKRQSQKQQGYTKEEDEDTLIRKFLEMCNFKIRGMKNINSIFDLYIIYYNKEMLFATVAAIYVILQTAIPDYPVKGVGHERETRVHFTISDFYNDEYIKPKQQYTTEANSKATKTNPTDRSDGAVDSEEAEIGNRQIVTLFTKMLNDGKQRGSSISFGSLLTGIIKMTESDIQVKLSDMINDFKSGDHDDINVLYENKREYRIHLAEEMREMSYSLKDWHTFKPTYIEEDKHPVKSIQQLIENIQTKMAKYNTSSRTSEPVSLVSAKFDNYYFSVSLLKLLNEYVTRSDKLVGTEFLYNSVNLTPIQTLVEQYAYYTFSLLSEPEYLDFNLLLPQFKQTIVSLISTSAKLDHSINEQSVDHILKPLPYSVPYKHKLMTYFHFQKVLTHHLSLEEKINYYQKALKDILLTFDISIDASDIKGTGKRREYMNILSNARFDQFLASMFEITQDREDRDEYTDLERGDARFMFKGNERDELVDIRKVSHSEQAELLIQRWSVPYDKSVTKDACGNKSKLDYLEIANVHLAKIDVLSGKSSFELYKETTEYIEQLDNNINVYEDLLNSLLKYINRNNLELFNGKKMKRIPDDSELAVYKKETIHNTHSSINYHKMIKLFYNCIINMNGNGRLGSGELYSNYISKLSNVQSYYSDLSKVHPDNLADEIRNIWYSQQGTGNNRGVTQISEEMKRKILSSLEIRDEKLREFFNLDFQRNNKTYEAMNDIQNVLSMNGLVNDMLIPITLLPKNHQTIAIENLNRHNSQKLINTELLVENKVQQNNKDHALSILKYLQMFHQHMCIIKNNLSNVKIYGNVTLGWNKFEINQTSLAQENEFSPFLDKLKIFKSNKDVFKYFSDILENLFGKNEIQDDIPMINIPQIVLNLSSLQYQVNKDVPLLLPYEKIFTGEHYYELVRGTFYSIIFKVIDEIEEISGDSSIKDAVMVMFRELMEVVLSKMSKMYEFDSKTDGDIQDDLDKQKGLQNQLRKKNFDKMNPSERVLYAFRRSQGVADVFKTISEQQLREAELADNIQFMSVGEETDGPNDGEGHGGRDMRDGVDPTVLGEDDDEYDRDN
jgi:hypothetical protein